MMATAVYQHDFTLKFNWRDLIAFEQPGRQRHLSPTTGRFLQSDPDPGKRLEPRTLISQYVYALNLPTKNVDPTGNLSGVANDSDLTDVHGYYCGWHATGQAWSGSNGKYDWDDKTKLPPQDFVDSACAYHDDAYGSYNDWAALNEAPHRLESDLKLLQAGFGDLPTHPLTGLAVMLGAAFYIGVIEPFLIVYDIFAGLAGLFH